ncbi:hypothetical protein F5Y14DRAFT_452302 [Nemania sp. NC0429]|nr:hypothetical protein F5Y14DRAFT_452302 [Nemania sp. NC0429]
MTRWRNQHLKPGDSATYTDRVLAVPPRSRANGSGQATRDKVWWQGNAVNNLKHTIVHSLEYMTTATRASQRLTHLVLSGPVWSCLLLAATTSHWIWAIKKHTSERGETGWQQKQGARAGAKARLSPDLGVSLHCTAPTKTW